MRKAVDSSRFHGYKLIFCMGKGEGVSNVRQFSGAIFGDWVMRRKVAGLVIILAVFLVKQDGYILDMGIWDNFIWSWKLDWTEALNDTDAETARELHALLEQVQPNCSSRDRRKWIPNSAGFFSVCSAYEAQQPACSGCDRHTDRGSAEAAMV
ncbi:hypothetical protein A2U01_0011413 [Trifolium medium]|uniref:Uncharacterized protein n=1 Tax=Trifolium medium TaxID=97028 RepID=A0A392MSK8_9FABA|nr:hypothetical protein [Trifolium medium]